MALPTIKIPDFDTKFFVVFAAFVILLMSVFLHYALQFEGSNQSLLLSIGIFIGLSGFSVFILVFIGRLQ